MEELEIKKIKCETIRKIVYGIELDELPPASVLREIEDDCGIVLEFKYHFRFLVPQVYGWEYMGQYMYDGKEFPPQPGKPEEADNTIAERMSLRPDDWRPNYFEYCHHLFEERSGYPAPYRMKLTNAETICQNLFNDFLWYREDIENEEKYLEEKNKQGAVLDAMYSQLRKHFGDELEEKIYSGSLLHKFVDDLIENRLMQCKDTLSGDDSCLNNFWEEFCVQVQQEQSFHWQTYLDQLHLWIKTGFEKLPMWQRNTIWLTLKDEAITDYFNTEYDPYDSEYEEKPFYEDDATKVDIENKDYYDINEVAELITEKVEEEAANFSNKAIERYIDGEVDDNDSETEHEELSPWDRRLSYFFPIMKDKSRINIAQDGSRSITLRPDENLDAMIKSAYTPFEEELSKIIEGLNWFVACDGDETVIVWNIMLPVYGDVHIEKKNLADTAKQVRNMVDTLDKNIIINQLVDYEGCDETGQPNNFFEIIRQSDEYEKDLKALAARLEDTIRV